MIITGKKLTTSTWNPVHLLTAGDRIARSRPKTPAQEHNNCPRTEKANWHQQWLQNVNKRLQKLKHGR
jgi:hypothetical protein